MNNVDELKQYVGVHARGLEIAGYPQLLARITDDDEGPGSWVGEWCAEGERLATAGRPLEAARHYLMARFPFVDGPARENAYRKSLSAFDEWRVGQRIERLDLTVDGHRVGCWTAGLSPSKRRPLVVILGGFLTLKEQWAPALPVFQRLGFAAVVTEMPGVGENGVPYDRESWRFLPAVLDAVADLADVSQSYAFAMSFSGHQALRAATVDPRIRGVVTAGAPISEFFTDQVWQKSLPKVSVDTLKHLTGVEVSELSEWALSRPELAGLQIPLAYLVSTRDEVIPAGDIDLLRREVADLRLLVHDDVHGSPGHTDENKLWMALALLKMQRSGHRMMIAVLTLMWRATRLRYGRVIADNF